MNYRNDLSSGIVRHLFNYDPDAGSLTWKEDQNSGKVKAGTEAGAISQGYRRVSVNGKSYMVHRIAWLYMNGDFPPHQIDHINRNRQDNRWANLREVTPAQNGQNKKIYKRNTSGVAGVCQKKRDGKWSAQIGVNGKRIFIGDFSTKSAAIEARKKYVEEFHPYRTTT